MLRQIALGTMPSIITETPERKYAMPFHPSMFSPIGNGPVNPMDLSRFLHLCYAQPVLPPLPAGAVPASLFPLSLYGARSQPSIRVPNLGSSLQACAQMQVPELHASPVSPPMVKCEKPNQSGNSRKRCMSSDDETESASSTGETSLKPARTVKRERLGTGEENSEMGLGGESRLKINFLNLGNPGRHPQVFGKSRLGVPDRLSGTYVLYSERWRSEILHENEVYRAEDGTQHVLITWKITNLTSGVTQARTETVREAILRHKDGRTLCNKVFRKALEHRAQELEEEVKKEMNPIRVKTMKNLIKKLRPKHFSEGPLVFGLRHECVQNRFKSMTKLDGDGFLVTKEGVLGL